MRVTAAAALWATTTVGPASAQSSPPSPPAEVKLEARFPEGQPLRYQVRTSMNQLVKNLGMEMPSNLNRTVIYAESIGKRRADGTLPVSVKVHSLRERQRLPGGLDVNYDSKEGDARVAHPDIDFFKDLYRVDSQVAFTAMLDDRNRVKGIEGTEAIRDRVEKIDPRAADLLHSRLAADGLRQEFDRTHVLSALPDGPVKPGASWERTEAVDRGAGMELVLHKKYEYVGTEKRGGKELDTIKSRVLDVQCRQDADSSSPLKLTKGDLKVNSSEGTIHFDRDAGRVVEWRDRIELTGNLTLSAQGQDQRVGFDLTMRTEVQFQAEGR